MLLVRRVEGCFGEAVEALERSLWGRVGGMLWRRSVGLQGEKWRGECMMEYTINDVTLVDTRVVSKRVSVYSTVLHHVAVSSTYWRGIIRT